MSVMFFSPGLNFLYNLFRLLLLLNIYCVRAARRIVLQLPCKVTVLYLKIVCTTVKCSWNVCTWFCHVFATIFSSLLTRLVSCETKSSRGRTYEFLVHFIKEKVHDVSSLLVEPWRKNILKWMLIGLNWCVCVMSSVEACCRHGRYHLNGYIACTKRKLQTGPCDDCPRRRGRGRGKRQRARKNREAGAENESVEGK